QGMNAFEFARQAAEEAGLPMMVHIDEPPPSYEELVSAMRPRDVLTHCFRPFPNCPATAQGTVKQAVQDARGRGVLFDVGHGMGSFSFKTTRAMLANGFLPDTISSDIHQLCIDGPAYDQVTTLSKFLCMGIDLPEVLKMSTENAGLMLGRPELGTLKPGVPGDATILRIDEGQFRYEDVTGEEMIGDRRIFSDGVVLNGKWWHPT
ncbi:MAG: amidohydrolase/deacetylase family metallohydrolase, partial [Pseudomonadota bacterium]